jgi:hypothetical protein
MEGMALLGFGLKIITILFSIQKAHYQCRAIKSLK